MSIVFKYFSDVDISFDKSLQMHTTIGTERMRMNVREMKINKNLLMTILHVNNFFFLLDFNSDSIFTELYPFVCSEI